MNVSQLMVRDVKICNADDDLASVARILWSKHVGCLPVVDPDSRVVGFITDRDICLAAYKQGWPLHEISVRSAMSKDVIVTSPDATISEVEAIMRLYKLRRLPIVDSEHRVLGIVSLTDLTLEARREVGRRIAEINADDVMDVLASISEHGGRLRH